MKKLLLVLLVLSCLYLPERSQAQNTFAPVGAEWWYGGDYFDYGYWNGATSKWADQLLSVKDTVVAGRACRLLAATRYEKNPSAPDATIISKRDTFFISNTVDTVFVYDSVISDFTPLYVFNVQVGDTVCLRQPNSIDADPVFCYVVDSIKTETYDTAYLRSFYNHTISGRSFNWGVAQYLPQQNKYLNSGKYTEKIGGNWPKVGSFLPEVSYENPDYTKSDHLPTGTLRCYNDPLTAIKTLQIACDSVLSPYLSIRGSDQVACGITVYPNPSAGLLTVLAKKAMSARLDIRIADLSGRVLETMILPAGKNSATANLEQLSPGAYFLSLRMEGQQYYQKIIISR